MKSEIEGQTLQWQNEKEQTMIYKTVRYIERLSNTNTTKNHV